MAAMVLGSVLLVPAQDADFGPPGGGPGFGGPLPFGPPDFAPGGFGPGFPGGMTQEKVKLVRQFDKNGDGWLNQQERKAARAARAQQGGNRQMGPGRGGRPGRFGLPGESQETAQPGVKISPADVKSFGDAPFYATNVLRTLFLEFENADWEKELEDFHNTDVEVPAKLTVDGKTYPDVGVRFRGASSYMMLGTGQKRSLNLSVDMAHENQAVGGYRTLNLLNSHGDPTFLRAVLYYQIAREYLPAPQANWVRLVINGEYWGVYVNVQQFNKDFLKEWYGTKKGARWKVSGSPNGRGGLNYLGDDVAAYQRIYELKSKEDPKAWQDFIKLCKTLNATPAEKLEGALTGLLDTDGALKFLALENVFINNDGYWVRASDYDLYEDEKGCFHIIPYDVNESFSAAGGPGFGGGPGGGRRGFGPGGFGFGGGPGGLGADGVKLDPLVAANDSAKPLASKLLAVPALRARYLQYVRAIADKWLDWKRLGPLAAQYQNLIADAVKADTRKLASYAAFQNGIAGDVSALADGFHGPGATMSLKHFAEQRRSYLLNYPESKQAAR